MNTPEIASFTSMKTYRNLPCSHRQWRHDGHCAFIHGYSRSYTLRFAAAALDPNHFVVDFGTLKPLKAWLDHWFDHTCLINADDPELDLFRELHARGIVDLRVMPNVSMEGSAWFAVKASDKLSFSARAKVQNWSDYDGVDSALNPMMVPTARTDLRGGKRFDVPIGVNYYVNEGSLSGLRFLAEYDIPVWQDLSGPQLETKGIFTIGAQLSVDPG